jgi:5-oxoprolinase (ATP-hydrolysing)
MGLADIRATRTQALEESLSAKALAAVNRIGKKLGGEVKREVASQGVAASQIRVIVRAHLRYAGTDTPLEVVAGPIKENAERLSKPRTRRASASWTATRKS